MPEREYNDFANIYLHTIGNLTLSGNNGILGNKPFMDKKWMNKNGKEQGYHYSRLMLNRFLNEIDEWNVANYKKRTDILIKRFISIWQLPQVEGIKELPEQNISDIDDPTNKQIEYAVFFGKRLDGDKFKGIKLYNYIIKELYKLQPEGFVEQFSSLLRLREDPNELHRYQSLNSTYYYDTNLSYQSIFSNLKTMLEKMQLTDELYIKFRGATRTLFDNEESADSIANHENSSGEKDFKARCVEKVENRLGAKLVKLSRSCFRTVDGEKGFYFATSKIYPDPRGEKYWFGYRTNPVLDGCKECYYIFGCKNENTIIVLSQKQLDDNSWQMNYSADDETGEIRHWHVVFIKKQDGNVVWSLSKPNMHEIGITQYLIDGSNIF